MHRHSPKAALLREALDFDSLLLRWEGLIELHIQGAVEGDEAEFFHELAAVALMGEEVLGLIGFSMHENTRITFSPILIS